MNLICFPYAGGSAGKSFPWIKLLPKEINLESVEYPGHGKYFQKPLIHDFDQMIDYLFIELKEKMQLPFVFFGHSLGGILCFELTNRLQELGLPLPVHLFLSGCRPPQIKRKSLSWNQLSDEEFLLAVQSRHHSIPDGIIKNSELLQHYVAVLRADYAMAESYHYVVKPPLTCPITAVAGDKDYIVSAKELEEWCRHTTSTFNRVIIPGNHLSIIWEPEVLVQQVVLKHIR